MLCAAVPVQTFETIARWDAQIFGPWEACANDRSATPDDRWLIDFAADQFIDATFARKHVGAAIQGRVPGFHVVHAAFSSLTTFPWGRNQGFGEPIKIYSPEKKMWDILAW